MEIANSVFMQYQKQADGQVKELVQKNVDFGGGLERMLAATADNPDIFQTDLYWEIMTTMENVSGKKYSSEEEKPAMRVIADHLKAATFMAMEGLEPSNKQQGYILRRLIRRAVVKMHQLEITSAKAELGNKICLAVGRIYDRLYFDTSNKSFLKKIIIITEEINRFEKTLNRGIKLLEKYPQVDGKIAFDLYQSFGFPKELTFEIAATRGQVIDRTQFDVEFRKHQEKSRTAAAGMFKGGLQDQSETIVKLHTATHLLQQALREILGDHVRQKGSNITVVRLRFDFSHPDKLTEEQIKKIESLVNERIKENLPVSMQAIPLHEALASGALTVPGVSYPEKVKVYSISSFSKEVCGGPHVDFTGRLGSFKIIKEEALGVNIRRIYASLS
jgi:alanyl-tRNA synthetase